MVLQRYRAKAELGKGSFGTVYLTEGRRDKKTYVVKVGAHKSIFETHILQAHRQRCFLPPSMLEKEPFPFFTRLMLVQVVCVY